MAKLIHDKKIFGAPKHGRTMPEPFTGDTTILGIEKHGITKYKQTPEPYFGPASVDFGGVTSAMPTPGKIRDDECMGGVGMFAIEKGR